MEKGEHTGMQARSNGPGASHAIALGTAWLECRRCGLNSWCSGEMRRYQEEHRWRRRPAGLQLTLRPESVGSKQD